MRPTSFEFVTFANPNGMREKGVKTQIRKHAMKDIGATRRRPKKRRQRSIELCVLSPIAPSPTSTIVTSGAVDPFLQYPVELGRTEKELVTNSKFSFRGISRSLVRQYARHSAQAVDVYLSVLGLPESPS